MRGKLTNNSFAAVFCAAGDLKHICTSSLKILYIYISYINVSACLFAVISQEDISAVR